MLRAIPFALLSLTLAVSHAQAPHNTQQGCLAHKAELRQEGSSLELLSHGVYDGNNQTLMTTLSPYLRGATEGQVIRTPGPHSHIVWRGIDHYRTIVLSLHREAPFEYCVFAPKKRSKTV